MAFFNASTSASLSSEGGLTEEDLKRFEMSGRRKSRESFVLHRTFSTPTPSSNFRPSRSSTCPSRSINWNFRRSNFSFRSLRSISSPSRMSSIPVKHNIQKFHSLLGAASSSVDSNSKSQDPKNFSCQSMNNSNFSDQEVFENSNEGLQGSCESQNLLMQNCASRVGRSISSPEGLHPVSLQLPSNCYPFHSPSSPGRFTYPSSARTESQDILNGRTSVSTTVSTANHPLPSPSVSFSGDYQITSSDRCNMNLLSPALQGASISLNSSLYSSITSMRGRVDSEFSIASGIDPVSYNLRQGSSPYWAGEVSPRVNVRLLRGNSDERPRLSQLALAHLTSRDLSSIHFQTPPPSYEKLCNPEALPTYQEAIEGERRFKRFQDQRMVFTLPSVPDYNASHTDPLLQETQRSFSGGILASLAAELSDSEGGYTTILDAIPGHPVRESCHPVPVRFASRCSLHSLRPPRGRLPCFTPVCNVPLVKKELNRRWPFIVSAREDERCLGLLLVECSSNLTVAQLSEAPASAGPAEGGRIPSHDPLESTFPTDLEGADTEFSALNINLETTALNSHVMFYLCGKCVAYDSFDADRVRAHIDYDCSGHTNKWANISELYLIMRAFCFVFVVVLVLMWLPFGRW